MTNINPSKIILKVRTAMWYLFFQTIGIWLLSSCEQKDLCYDHNHASNVKVTFDWEQYPNANPASMCFYLFPREEGERTLKREFIGKNGGIAQALVGVSYTALGFNSDARNTSFRYNISTNSIEASSKDAGAIDRIGISASLLPRAKGTEGERMSMEADSIYSSASEKDILISLEENDRGDTCKITLSPKRRFCTYRLKIMNIDTHQDSFRLISKDENTCTIEPVDFLPQMTFEEWKNSIETTVSNNKGANLMLPKGTSPTDEYIINKVRSFNIESKTPMDCMMFLVDLKKKINGEV